jgi:hypothetical protein
MQGVAPRLRAGLPGSLFPVSNVELARPGIPLEIRTRNRQRIRTSREFPAGETSVPRISKRASPPARLSPGSALRRGTARLLGRPELEDRSVSEGRAGKSGTHGLPGRMAGFLRRDVRASSGSEDGPLDACRVAPVADRVVESGPRGLCATPARPLNSVMRGRGRAPRR